MRVQVCDDIVVVANLLSLGVSRVNKGENVGHIPEAGPS
jgi:hypothetical protein